MRVGSVMKFGARRRYVFAAVLAILATAAVEARGLAVRDLVSVQGAVKKSLGSGFIARAQPNRLDLICIGCVDQPIIGLQLGRQTDGTEERVRLGQTRIVDLEQICKARSPECRLSALSVAPAVGWVSSYAIGDTAGATAVIIQDGDLLTIRSLADDPITARRGIDKLLPLIRARMIGR